MSSPIKVEVDASANPSPAELLPEIELDEKQLEAAHRVMARGVEVLIEDHFRVRDQTPNALGGQRTNFWAQLAGATSVTSASSTGATVTVADERFALKVHGGTVRPKNAKALTIPIHPAAHGKRASQLNVELFIVRTSTNAFLAGKSGSGDELTFYYVLKDSVTHDPDPEALPTDDEVERTMERSFERWLDLESRESDAA